MIILRAMLASVLSILLIACGPESGNDQNTPPPQLGKDFTVRVATPQLVVPEGASETKLVVDFEVFDASGRAYEFDATKDFRIAVLKAMPQRSGGGRDGNTFWKSFHHSSNDATNRASMENVWTAGGELLKTESGYTYTFAIADILNVADPYPTDSVDNGGMIAWDEDKLHRIVMAYGDQELGFTYVYQWIPGTPSDQTVSRNVIEDETCSNCHMGEPLHHGPGYRSIDNNIAVCTSCHNDSNPGAAPRRRPLAAIVHQYHGNVYALGSSSSDPTTYKQPVDSNGVLVTDINGLVMEGNPFPQDARNCTTCHSQDVTKASDANNWFEHPSQVACESCHLYRDRGAHDNEVGFTWDRETCTGCHRPYERDENGDPIIGMDASRSARTVHLGRLDNLAAARDTLLVSIKQARFVDSMFEVDVIIQKDGVGISALSEITPFINEHGHVNLLLNWDNGEGPMLANNGLDLSTCTAQGNGLFTCQKDFTGATLLPTAMSTLTVNVADMPLCVDRTTGELADCSTFTGIDNLKYPYVIAAKNAKGTFDVGGITTPHTLPVGAEVTSCNNCHKELTIHKLGAHPHAATDLQQCKNCHNSERSAYYAGMAADLKYHVHSFHAFGSAHVGESVFPGAINNCEACHGSGQYNLPSQKNTRPSLASGKYFSPALVACGACHIESPLANADPDTIPGDAVLDHMIKNGAVFAADTAVEATGKEQCATCHAIGQEQGVDKVHKVYEYR
ncbi:OmcA/MtrC family decaheme c-type cytochrome [Vibrio vulnificus]|nr:OmcA/MtrC family decaheme c-type cytochrome [Vibrio vulnificus]EHY1119919.1 OmcA/MtrC family decaheme c-type cytochrome [Vibrio vulnificus]